jgi:hypothetical protein
MTKPACFDINIILPVASRGLLNDAEIIKQAIHKKDPSIYVRIISKKKGYISILLKSINVLVSYVFKQRQVSFHLEEIQPFFTRLSSQNFFIPNQEWLREKTRSKMNDDNMVVLCKTKYAVEQLKALSSKIHYIGFTSINRNNSTIPDYNKFIHIAGKSPQKGTKPLLELWSKTSNWPTLTVITTIPEYKKYNKYENINIISEFISEQALNALINKNGVHICPSEAEGFGHSIVEALSVGACLLTTNGAPMSELVADKQCLISPEKTSTRYLSDLFFVSESTLENTLTAVMNLSIEERAASGELSRLKYDELDANFNLNLSNILYKIKNHE